METLVEKSSDPDYNCCIERETIMYNIKADKHVNCITPQPGFRRGHQYRVECNSTVTSRKLKLTNDSGDIVTVQKHAFAPVHYSLKKGEKVVCLQNLSYFTAGILYPVREDSSIDEAHFRTIDNDRDTATKNKGYFVPERFFKLQTNEDTDMNIDLKTLLMFQMMSGNNGEGTNMMSSLMPLLLLGDGNKLKLDRAMLLNAIPDLTDNERQSISEGNTEAAVTSILARQMKDSTNPLGGLLPLMLLGDDD